MVVVCKVAACPYRSKEGICRNKLLSITENGLCGHVYNKKGQIKSNWQEQVLQVYKEREVVINE